MIFTLTNISAILLITTCVNLVTTFLSWRRRKSEGGIYFAGAMTAITFWTLASALDYAAVPIPAKVLFAKFETIGYNSALALFGWYGLSYLGYKFLQEKLWVKTIFTVMPLSNILLAWTNDYHGLVWSGFSRTLSNQNIVIFHHGPAFTWITLNGYLIITGIVANLWLASRRGSELLRRQARLLFLASLIPIISNIFYLLDLPNLRGIDLTSITFSISGIFFLAALYGPRFLDIVPIARYSMIEGMRDCVLVLDTRNYLVDFNPSAGEVFRLHHSHLGKMITSVMSDWPEIIRLSLTTPASATPSIAIHKNGNIVYDTRMTTLQDNREQLYGKLIISRNITKRYQAEQVNQLRLKLWEFSVSGSLDSLMQIALDEICAMTGSLIGFYHFVENDQKTLSLQAWSTRTLEEFCQSEGKGAHYDIDEAGVWVDAFHQRAPVIHNDYSSLPHRKGLPDGHAEVIRQLVVPIVRNERVVSLLGVGNKPADYSEWDVEMVSKVADMIWTIVSYKMTEEELQQTQAHLVEQQRELAKIEERQRMARNLHDSVSQSTHSMILFSETLAATLEKGKYARAQQILGNVQESARQLHKETRLMLYELQGSGPGNTIDLIPDLEERLTRVEHHLGIQAVLEVEGSLEYCPVDWHEDLFWMTIEALNNALKHAQAKQIQILINCSPEQFILKVVDDGIGFDPDKVPAGGMGLENMRQRAAILGGELVIESRPIRGACVRFSASLLETARNNHEDD